MSKESKKNKDQAKENPKNKEESSIDEDKIDNLKEESKDPNKEIPQKEHRAKLPFVLPIAAVSRKVPQKEMLEDKEANAAVDKEWDKLRFHPHPGTRH
ncbi:MAG: hypothetical protein QF426_05200, partial [Verrucomicrobiales bacterium]|nr:hypothetical protein [Verrucomicrobiales bacterium]